MSNIQSTQDYYNRFKNSNLFISNNANPFLISPYSPAQLSKTTGNMILAADTITSYTPGKIINVTSPMNMNATTKNPLLIRGNPVLTDTIYSGGLLGNGVNWNVQSDPTQQITGQFNNYSQITFTSNNAIFVTDNNTTPYTFFIGKSGVSPGNLTVYGNTTTSSLTLNTTIDPGVRASTGTYIPITVNGTVYYVLLYL